MTELNGQSCTRIDMVARINDRELAAERFDNMQAFSTGGAPIVPLWDVPNPELVVRWQQHVGPMSASLLRVIGRTVNV